MSIGRRTAHRKRLPPRPPQPPPGWVTVADACRHDWPTGFAPGEAMQAQAQHCMQLGGSMNFRQLDRGNDYDLAARTKAARAARSE